MFYSMTPLSFYTVKNNIGDMMELIETFDNFDVTEWCEIRIHMKEGTENVRGIISDLKEINKDYPESHYVCSNSDNEVETVTMWHMYYPHSSFEEVGGKIKACLDSYGFHEGNNGFNDGDIIKCPCKS